MFSMLVSKEVVELTAVTCVLDRLKMLSCLYK